MEYIELVKKRRSVRAYEPTAVEDSILEEIIEAGLWAPSGTNLQPWFFVVVRSPKKMRLLREIMSRVSEDALIKLTKRFPDKPELVAGTTSFVACLGNAPAAILAFRDKDDYRGIVNDSSVIQSVAAAMENIQLAIYDHGLCSCWMTAPNQAGMDAEMRDTFAPGHGELVCMTPVGYPKEGEEIKTPKRRDGKFVFV